MITEILQHGKVNAVPARKLASMLAVDDRRMRFLIQCERMSGKVILADEHGYYLPSEDDIEATAEIKSFIRRFDARAVSNRLSTLSAKNALKVLVNSELDGQGNIFDEQY